MSDWHATARRYSTHISVAIMALLAYVPTLMSSPGRMPADTKLYLYLDPGRLTSDAPWTIDPRQFAGWVPHQHITYLWPAGPWYWFWDTVGMPDWVAHRLWLGTLFFVAGLGARWLARVLGIGIPGALVAGLVYQLSPYILPYVSRTSLMLAPWAGLGWIVGLTARAAARGRWRDVAIIALIIATVGSPNATALAMVAPAPVLWLVHAAWARSITWRRAAITAGKIGGLSICVSLWWIAMLSVQGKYGAEVLDYSESLEAVSFSSNSSEVLRGLGYWLFYLRDTYAATTSSSIDYLTSTGLVFVGYALVGVCLLGLVATKWPHRRFALLIFAAGVLLAVGPHPLSDPSPLTDFLIDDTNSGLALALRSSTRAVPMAVLGLALGAGTLVAAARPRRSWGRAFVPVVVVALAVLNLPSLWRHDFVDPALDRDENPPAAWLEAAAALDSKANGYRVFQVPGQEFGAYRWGYTVDQPLPGLTSRPVVTRDLLPLGSAQAMDLLYAIDDRFQDGVLEPETIAPLSRLFGADTLWVLNDSAFERFRTPRPEVMAELFGSNTEGLGKADEFGTPFVNEPDIDMTDDESLTTRSIGKPVPPVMLVPVDDPIPVVRAKSERVIVSGSGDGVVDAAAAGLIDGSELLRYSADLNDEEAKRAIRSARLLIVTDSNRDRARRWNGSQDNTGFTESGGPANDLLRPESADARIPYFVNTDPATQTTAHQIGPVTAMATGYGEPFAYLPEDRAAMAIDGRLDTGWTVADRGFDPVGQRIRLEVAEPVDHVVLTQAAAAIRQRHITAVDLKIGDRPSQRVELSAVSFEEGQRIDFDATDGPTTVTITVASTASPVEVPGPSKAGVGFREIDFGLGPTIEVVELPSDLLDRLGPKATNVPLGLVLTRQRYDAKNRYRSDPEPSMIRGFTLSAPLDARIEVTARLNPRASDRLLQRLLDVDAPRASVRVAGDPRSSGWATVDGNPGTHWLTPFAYPQGARLNVPVPASQASLQSFTITQPDGPEYSRITAVRVVAGDDEWLLRVPEPDADGASTIKLPEAVRTTSISLIVAEVEDEYFFDRRFGEPVYPPAAISEISIGPRVELPASVDTGCRDDLLRIDDEPISLRLQADTEDLLSGRAITLSVCDDSEIELSAAAHRVTSTPGHDTGIDIDRVVLSSPRTPAPAAGSGIASTQILSSSRTSTTVQVGPCPDGCWIVFGQGYNPEWTATAVRRADEDGWPADNSSSLGPPTRVDGGFNGWWIPPTNRRLVVNIDWQAQGRVTFGLIVSGIAALLAVAMIILDRRKTSIADPSPAAPVRAGLVAPGPATRLPIAAIAAAIGVVTAGLVIEPVAALWIAIAAVAVAVTRRPRLAGYAAVAMALYVGGTVCYIVRRDKPWPDGSWLTHVEWLHPFGLAVVALVMIAAVGGDDEADDPPRSA